MIQVQTALRERKCHTCQKKIKVGEVCVTYWRYGSYGLNICKECFSRLCREFADHIFLKKEKKNDEH